LRAAHRSIAWAALFLATIGGACSPQTRGSRSFASAEPVTLAGAAQAPALLNRVTWGVDNKSVEQVSGQSLADFLERQLEPSADDDLPAGIAKEVADLTATMGTPQEIAATLQRERQAIQGSKTSADANIAARASYLQTLTHLRQMAADRFLLRAIYSKNQLLEQVTWFWLNHFSVFPPKTEVGAWMADYEDNAIRRNALGGFRDLLAATVHHPAMLLYLDNVQNARGHLNENYARELMELHTLGIGGGYSQADVEALARILTGLRVNETGAPRTVPPSFAAQYRSNGLFEFEPRRHDYSDKIFLGHTIRGGGFAEIDEALDLLSRSPATARFVSRKLALFFVSDDPSDQLVGDMADTFRRTDGNIGAILRTLFASQEFARSLGKKFKDPMHFVLSAVRATKDDSAIGNLQPMENWLTLLGEPVFGCQDPNGYPLTPSAWTSSGAMLSRIRIAKSLASGRSPLFAAPGSPTMEEPRPPQLQNTAYYGAVAPILGPATRNVLAQASSAAQFDMLFLSSPEFMYR